MDRNCSSETSSYSFPNTHNSNTNAAHARVETESLTLNSSTTMAQNKPNSRPSSHLTLNRPKSSRSSFPSSSLVVGAGPAMLRSTNSISTPRNRLSSPLLSPASPLRQEIAFFSTDTTTTTTTADTKNYMNDKDALVTVTGNKTVITFQSSFKPSQQKPHRRSASAPSTKSPLLPYPSPIHAFPDPSAYGLESLCRLQASAPRKQLEKRNRKAVDEDEVTDETLSTDFKLVMANSNLVLFCEGVVDVRVQSSRFSSTRFIGIYSNHLFIYKSPKDRDLLFKIKLDATTKIQRSKKIAHGICVYHYDQILGVPNFCTLTAQDKDHQDSWIKSLVSAKQASASELF